MSPSFLRSLARPVAAALLILLLPGCQDSGSAEMPVDEAAPFGLDPDRLFRGEVVSDMTIIHGDDRRPLGVARTSISDAEVDGQPALRFVLIQELQMGTMYDTLMVHRETLLPIRYRNDMGEFQQINMNWDADGRVRSRVDRSGVITGIDTVMAEPRLDAAEFSMLVPALPLAEGYAAQIPVTHYENGAGTRSVSVESAGNVEYNGEMRPVWTVAVETPTGTMRTAIDRETGMVLQTIADLGPGRYFEQIAR